MIVIASCVSWQQTKLKAEPVKQAQHMNMPVTTSLMELQQGRYSVSADMCVSLNSHVDYKRSHTEALHL